VDADAEEVVDPSDRPGRIVRRISRRRDLTEERLAREDARTRAQFVADDEVEAAQLLAGQEIDEIPDRLPLRVRDEEAVRDVAVEDELVRRPGEVEAADRVGPRRGGHGASRSKRLESER